MTIGSRAILELYPEFDEFRAKWISILNPKILNDNDLILTPRQYAKFILEHQNYIIEVKERFPNHYVLTMDDNSRWEIELATPGSSGAKYLELHQSGVPAQDILLSIYKSHIFMPINWRKHIISYTFLNALASDDSLKETTKQRFAENESIHGKLRTPSLNKSKDDFFDDKTINIRVFEHDEIHRIIAHKDVPIYTQIKPDQDKVLCSKELWDNLSQEDKDYCVLEESYVIALERKIIPMLFLRKGLSSEQDSFLWALQRISTNLCSGWFRQYATDNALRLISIYDRNYTKKFLTAFEEGKIKKIET